MDPCSITNGSSSPIRSWSRLALAKNDACAAERLEKPQADSTSTGACRLAGVSITRSRNKEQSPDSYPRINSALFITGRKGCTWSKYALTRASLFILSVSKTRIDNEKRGCQDCLTSDVVEVDQRPPSCQDIRCQCHPIGGAWPKYSCEE